MIILPVYYVLLLLVTYLLFTWCNRIKWLIVIHFLLWGPMHILNHLRVYPKVGVYHTDVQFLGVFATLWKATLSNVCLSVCVEWHTSHWTDLHEIWCEDCLKICQEDQVWLKSDNTNRYFTRWPMRICNILLNSS